MFNAARGTYTVKGSLPVPVGVDHRGDQAAALDSPAPPTTDAPDYAEARYHDHHQCGRDRDNHHIAGRDERSNHGLAHAVGRRQVASGSCAFCSGAGDWRITIILMDARCDLAPQSSTDGTSITVVIFCWRDCLISESMGHYDSEIMDDGGID